MGLFSNKRSLLYIIDRVLEEEQIIKKSILFKLETINIKMGIQESYLQPSTKIGQKWKCDSGYDLVFNAVVLSLHIFFSF